MRYLKQAAIARHHTLLRVVFPQRKVRSCHCFRLQKTYKILKSIQQHYVEQRRWLSSIFDIDKHTLTNLLFKICYRLKIHILSSLLFQSNLLLQVLLLRHQHRYNFFVVNRTFRDRTILKFCYALGLCRKQSNTQSSIKSKLLNLIAGSNVHDNRTWASTRYHIFDDLQ